MTPFADFLDTLHAHIVEWWSKQGPITRGQPFMAAVTLSAGSVLLTWGFFSRGMWQVVLNWWGGMYIIVGIAFVAGARRLSQW